MKPGTLSVGSMGGMEIETIATEYVSPVLDAHFPGCCDVEIPFHTTPCESEDLRRDLYPAVISALRDVRIATLLELPPLLCDGCKEGDAIFYDLSIHPTVDHEFTDREGKPHQIWCCAEEIILKLMEMWE